MTVDETRPLRHAMYRLGWFGRNRWGLLLLPVAVTAALAASSDRVQLYFWDEGLHQPTTGTAGKWVDFRDTYNDRDGDHPFQVRVRLDSVAPARTGWQSTSALELPSGSRALTVNLSLEADPALPLTVCKLALRDAAGTRYDYQFNTGEQPISPCVPPDARGPNAAVLPSDPKPSAAGADGQPARPAAWTVAPVIIVPTGVNVTEVDLWWELPDYVALTLP
jgi:hypothetical protein